MNKKQTSKNTASLAARTLRDNKSSNIQKTVAASVLAQRSKQKQTGVQMESIVSKVLKSTKYSDTTKKLAASALSQSNKNR